MNGHDMPTSYLDRLEAFRRSDTERDDLVAEIIKKYEELKLRYDEKCDDYSNEVESRRLWQTKAREHEVALREHRQVSGSFALAILDGDGAVFQDYLYAQGKNGGADAAHQLHTELRNHLRSLYPESSVSDWTIVVQVILNLQGLGAKLQACNLIVSSNELVSFGRAFGLAQPLFSFIDVGVGKERADHKVRETLRLFLPIAQCKHIFFGPCHDNGYLPVLEPLRRDSTNASRLTLIETLPAEAGFIQLGLPRVRFPQIFRSQNLPSKLAAGCTPGITTQPTRQSMQSQRTSSTSGGTSAPTVPFVPHRTSPSPAPSAESNGSTSWATVGKGSTAGQAINIATKKTAPRRHILLNVHDDRVDPDLPTSDSNAFYRFAERVDKKGKFCNNYHLLGTCAAGQYCDYQHGERLSPGEQLVLKHKARSLYCPKKFDCRDFTCYLGHHCKFGSNCHLEYCRFADTHNMDMEPAKKFYEDGNEEWLTSYLETVRK